MNAAFFYGPNDIKIRKINIGKTSPDLKLLKVLSCSVCSYDVRTFRTGSFKVNPPIILGHEICAETVDEFESLDYIIKPGTRVSIYPIIPCFNCWYCNNKNFNLCTDLKEIGSTVNGGFAEYILVPPEVFRIGGIVPVLDNVSNEEASLIEPLACCINGINQLKPIDFESVIIIGDGPIGLMQLMLLRRQSPKLDITIIGKIDHRLQKARALGANRVFVYHENDSPEKFEILKGITGSISPNLIFVSNSNPSSLKTAFYLANKNGKVIIFSGIKDDKRRSNDKEFILNPNYIHYNQVSVFGSFSSNPENLKEAMDLVNSGEIRLKELISNTFSLANIDDAIAAAESFKGLKSVINRFNL